MPPRGLGGWETAALDADAVRAVYGRVAEPYAAAFFDELDRKPLDRRLLDDLARRCRRGGTVLDVGCGPGHAARYLRERGVAVQGLDLSPEMAALAMERTPGLRVHVGDLSALALPTHRVAAVVAFYSLIHLSRPAVPAALHELRRVLEPRGSLLLAVHAGVGTVHADDWFGQGVSVEATLFGADELVALLRGSGFSVEAVTLRRPYPFEHPTRRLYARATATEDADRRVGGA
jgi:SAM-dependent methyltransferase